MRQPRQQAVWPGRLALIAAALLLAWLWLVVFPWLASWPAMQSRLERHERHGIHAGAIFYTELE